MFVTKIETFFDINGSSTKIRTYKQGGIFTVDIVLKRKSLLKNGVKLNNISDR